MIDQKYKINTILLYKTFNICLKLKLEMFRKKIIPLINEKKFRGSK